MFFIVEKSKWHNRLDEGYGFLCLSIYPDIIFHLYGLTTPNQVWTKIESFFGVQYEIRVHRLENELFSLSQSSFKSIEGLFTKFKSLVLFLKQCGIKKKEDQLILSILSKLGPECSVFVSTFHATRIAISNWKMSSLSTFFDSLTMDKDELIHMCALISSKVNYHALKVQGSKNARSKEKQIVKEKKPNSDNENESSKPTDEGSMKKVKKKGSTSKCSYFRKGFHPDKKFFKKNMDIMS